MGDFAPVFDPLICEYHGINPSAKHTSDMDINKIKGNITEDVPVHSCRIRVGRSIDGFGLSPGITKEQRVGVEKLMISAVKNFPEDLAGNYYPLQGMNETVRQQLVDDHFLFVSGDRNLTVAGMERDWPEGRGIFHNDKKTFLIWVNEEDQLRIISNKHRLGYSEVQLVQKMIDGVNKLWEEDKEFQKQYFGDFPFIASQHSLVAKHVTKEKWDQLKNIKTKTSGFTLAKAIACAVQFNNQHCGIYAGDWDSYKDFAPVFDPLIQEYHGISPSARHTSDLAGNYY